jgi:hypothetical protein
MDAFYKKDIVHKKTNGDATSHFFQVGTREILQTGLVPMFRKEYVSKDKPVKNTYLINFDNDPPKGKRLSLKEFSGPVLQSHTSVIDSVARNYICRICNSGNGDIGMTENLEHAINQLKQCIYHRGVPFFVTDERILFIVFDLPDKFIINSAKGTPTWDLTKRMVKWRINNILDQKLGTKINTFTERVNAAYKRYKKEVGGGEETSSSSNESNSNDGTDVAAETPLPSNYVGMDFF